MQDWESDRGRIRAALEEALRIPGVHSAHFGPRYRRGQKTGEYALCVFVLRKKRLDEVAPRERVPAEILGVPTDVIESDLPATDAGEEDRDDPDPTDDLPDLDTKEYSQLRGGIQIHADGYGTLGCIARARDPEHDPKLVVLSNHHVLIGSGAASGGKVYQPERSCCCCGRRIGTVLRGRNTKTRHFYTSEPTLASVDAAIAILDPLVPCLAEMQIGVGNGTATELVRDVHPNASIQNNLAVKKRGQRTTQTMGTIIALDDTHAPDPADTSDNARAHRDQIVIEPIYAPGTTEGFFYFGAPGDSGSTVLTQAGDEMVALYWGGRRTYPAAPNRDLVVRVGLATNIHRVIDAMDIEIQTTSTAGDVLSNPAPTEAIEHDELPQPAMARTMLARAQADVEATQHGRRYAELIRRHHKEVWELINSNWRVAAIWNQNGGQKLVQVILDAVARPDAPIPSTIANRPVEEAAGHIATILKRFGSRALARDIDLYERAVPRLCGCTYNQLLARLRAGEPLLS